MGAGDGGRDEVEEEEEVEIQAGEAALETQPLARSSGSP